MKRLSCGVLLFDGAGRLLLGHATGTPRWDIPKGIAEPGETPLESALRETAEEAGIVLEPDSVVDLGRHAYLRDKDLHLHAALVQGLDAARCRCHTLVPDRRGGMRPEVDKCAWTPFEAVAPRVAKGLAAILEGRLPLVDVEAMLKRRVALAGPTHWRYLDGAGG